MENINNKVNQTEERICGLEDRTFKIIQSEDNKEQRMKKGKESLCDLQGTIRRSNLNYWSLRRRKEGEGGQKSCSKK